MNNRGTEPTALDTRAMLLHAGLRPTEEACAALGDAINRLLGTFYAPRPDRPAYRHRRRARCRACGRLHRCHVSRDHRLRTQQSPCCGARLDAVRRKG